MHFTFSNSSLTLTKYGFSWAGSWGLSDLVLTSDLAALGFNAILLLLSLGLGRMAFFTVRLQWESDLEKVLFSVGLGYALVAYMLLAIGLAGALTHWTALGVLGVAAVATIVQTPAGFRSLAQAAQSRHGISRSPLVLGLIGLIAVHAALNLVGALAPPSMADTLRHHLAAPKYYAEVGGFPFVPVIYWNAPGVLHVLYTLELLLVNDIAPAVTHYLFALLTALAVYSLGRRYFNAKAGLLGAVIFYTLPMTTELSTAPMVELGATFFAVLLVHALLNAGRELDLRWVVLAGLFGGLAGATKLWALLTGPAGVVALFALSGARVFRNPRKVLSAVILYCIPYGLALSPWLLRNYLASGDPLWPLGYPLFHGQYWTAWQTLKFARWQLGPGDSFWHYVTGLWALTNNVDAFAPDRGPLSSALLSPVFLAFIPALWLFGNQHVTRWQHTRNVLALFCLTAYTIWFQGYQNVRYIQVVHPLISLLASAGIVAVLQDRRLSAILTAGALLTSFVVTLAGTLAFNTGFVSVVFGYQSRQDFLAANVSNYGSIAWANQHLPQDAKVLLVGLSGWYYLERDYWIGNSMYQGLIPFHKMRKPQQLLETLRQMGFTHLLVQANSKGKARLQEQVGNRGDHFAFLSSLADPPASVSDFERRPVALLAALEATGKLEFMRVGRDRVVNSRTFGGMRDVEFAVYVLHYPELQGRK